MKADFTLINPVNHYRKTLVDNLAILNLRAVSEAAGFSTHVIDFQRKFLEEEKTFFKRNLSVVLRRNKSNRLPCFWCFDHERLLYLGHHDSEDY